MPSQRVPPAKVHPYRRLVSGLLAAGAAIINGTVVYALVPVLGAASLNVRFKATGGGALDIVFVGPDFLVDQTAAFGSLVGTLHTTGNPTQVAVTANTEALITATCHGENYALIKYTPSANGVITAVDVATVPLSF